MTFEAVEAWLVSEGFSALPASGDGSLRFTGTVAQAESAFALEMVTFGDGEIYANTSDPSIPAQFAGVIASVLGLDNMARAVPATRQRSMNPVPVAAPRLRRGPVAQFSRSTPRAAAESKSPARPEAQLCDGNGDCVDAFGPADFWSFYDENPLFDRGLDGAGQCAAIVSLSDYLSASVSNFNHLFHLPASQITRRLVGPNPGINLDETETLLDLEYSHVTAPNAKTVLYIGKDLRSDISAAVNDNLCPAIGISFTICTSAGSFFTTTMDPIFAKAAAQGQSVFVSSGDDGAAGLVFDPIGMQCIPGATATVSELSADPNVTSIGGTGFNPNFDGNGDNVGSAPEFIWNDDLGAGGGGVSAVFAKPGYQSGFGVPDDGARDVPDLSLMASPLFPGAFFGDDMGRHAVIVCCIGGTSLSAQLWSGFAIVLAQAAGGRLGNINPRVYALANEDLLGNGFRDVTAGDNSFDGVAGFAAGPGFDLASGWGTVDMAGFADAYGNVPGSALATVPPASGAVRFGVQKLARNYAAKRVSLTNPKSGFPATIASVGLMLGAQFQIDPALSTCAAGFRLLPGKTCVVALLFQPSSASALNGMLVFTDSAANSPQEVQLTGTGK